MRFKFPRSAHIMNLGAATDDDWLLEGPELVSPPRGPGFVETRKKGIGSPLPETAHPMQESAHPCPAIWACSPARGRGLLLTMTLC